MGNLYFMFIANQADFKILEEIMHILKLEL